MTNFRDGGPHSRKFADEESTQCFVDRKKVDRCPSDDADKYKQPDYPKSFSDKCGESRLNSDS